jgi:hypothetical protein
MPSLLAISDTAPGWTTTRHVVESLSAADCRMRLHCANSGDRNARLDAVAADPRAVMPPSGPKTPPRSVR